MSTGLKTNQTGGLPANPSELLGALENVNTNLKAAGGLPFLRLLKDGNFVYGSDNTEIEEGSVWAANPYTIQHGYACWEVGADGKNTGNLLDEVMVNMNVAKPLISDLPDLGSPWKAQVSLQLQCLDGEDTGVVLLYKSTSLGLSNVVKDISGAVIAQLKSGENELIVPCVTLESDHYTHKQYGRTYFPVLEIQYWVDMEGAADDQDEANQESYEEPEQSEPPKKRGKKAPIEAAAGEEPVKKTRAKKEAAPTTRRRRRASS